MGTDAGQTGAHTQPRKRRRFVQKTFSLGPQQYFRGDKALAAAVARGRCRALAAILPARPHVFSRL